MEEIFAKIYFRGSGLSEKFLSFAGIHFRGRNEHFFFTGIHFREYFQNPFEKLSFVDNYF